MKKQMKLSIIAVGVLSALSANAAEDLSSMFSEGKTSGQIRTFYINRDDTTKDDKQIATAVGGHLKFETAAYEGLSVGAALYTTNRILDDLETDSMGPNTTLLKNDGSSYSLLGEAYLQYKRGNTTFKGGRQKLDTPLAGSDDARMLPNLFEAYLLINTDLPNTTLIGGHVTSFAPGTFANAYNGDVLGATAGYTAVPGNTATYQGDFTNMGTWAVGERTAGVSVVSATYTGIENLKIQAWDYYAHNILNAVYGQADFSWKCLITDAMKPSLSAQIIKENGVGDKLGVDDIDSLYAAAQFSVKISDLTASIAYSEQSKADAGESLQKSTVSPWGGMPAFTQGMVTRHMFLAGTKATKVAATYDFKNMGANVKATAYYATFDMDENSGYSTDRVTKEPGFDVIYNPEAVKNLELRFRGNFPTEFAENRDWDEYRFIANYNF
ncbi:MAG: OprD family outer membrane porin [Sulfurimonas sp.]|nr:OprD family outer membrane porin [Sulfurimonas sp.]MDD3060538.1 OprD family outer membrane porin [Sulfurimonas sp.]